MDTILINSKNSKTSDTHRLILNLSDKGVIDMMLYQIIAYAIHGQMQKCHTKTINLKYQLQHGIINSIEFDLTGRDR